MMQSDVYYKSFHKDALHIMKDNFNENIDRLLPKISQLILKNGMDPMQLLDVQLNGKLELSRGSLRNLSSLRRLENFEVEYGLKRLKICGSFVVDIISFEYDFVDKMLNLETGKAIGSLSGVNIYFEVQIDFNTDKMKFLKYQMHKTGDLIIDTKLDDTFLNVISKPIVMMTISCWKETIIAMMELKVKQTLYDYIDQMNKFPNIQTNLNNTSTRSFHEERCTEKRIFRWTYLLIIMCLLYYFIYFKYWKKLVKQYNIFKYHHSPCNHKVL